MKRRYRRNLPHVIPENTPIFVTWNLKGAIPSEVRGQIKARRRTLHAQPQRSGESVRERSLREEKQLLVETDRYLDRTECGPLHLKDPAAATIVEQELIRASAEQCELFAWCVMANHVHALMNPRIEWADVMQRIKGRSAYRINIAQSAAGRSLWQDESYDHWIRNDDSFFRVIQHIENNPVAAGLCNSAPDWMWSSARRRGIWKPGEPFRVEAGTG